MCINNYSIYVYIILLTAAACDTHDFFIVYFKSTEMKFVQNQKTIERHVSMQTILINLDLNF